MTHRRIVHVALLAAFPALALLGAQPALASTCQGKTVTIAGDAGSNQLIGTAGADVISGGDGNDVIKGGGGNDTICGGDGNDGINGGQSNDTIQGGDGYDFLVGGPDDDTIEGGAGSDAIYGSGGFDTLYGGVVSANGVSTDLEPDYIAGGWNPANAPDVIALGVGDEIHADKHVPNAATACPPSFAWLFGTYAPGRFTVESDLTCTVREGTMLGWETPSDNDGDGKFVLKIQGERSRIVEFMPRDKGYLPDLADESDKGQVVRVLGVLSLDGHDFKEIHPVFAIDVNNDGLWDSYSGPENGGSPASIRPRDRSHADSLWFCWDETGDPCSPWAGEPFS